MFIVFEGTDGAGKSTQVELFRHWLEQQNQVVTSCADPGTTPLGEAIREILLRRQDLNICQQSEMLMFMTARAQMVCEIIRPALERGEIVICDRYSMSTAVYQGYAAELEVEDIWEVSRVATSGLKPDLTLVFDLPIDQLRKRLGKTRDRMESRSDEYFERVVMGYRALAAADRNAFLVDAARPIEEVHQQICEIAKSKIPVG